MLIKNTLISFDERRDLFVAKDKPSAIAFAVENWVHSAQRAIQQRGRFVVALSGGSTPKSIYQALALLQVLDWSKIWLFWSDERAVPPDHPDSNYHMAMEALRPLPIPPSQVFRMEAEADIENNAKKYEELLERHLDKHLFDLVMLGMGEDGHTASLFPKTAALTVEDRLVVANHVPQKDCHRMTFTFPCIEQSRHVAIYALGSSKQEILAKVLTAPIQSPYPSSRLGTPEHKALWILDTEAAGKLTL